MSEQNQTINVTPVAIVPVQLKPVADILLVVPDRSAKINYIVGKHVPGVPEVPAIPGIVGRGATIDASGKVLSPPVEGKPAVAAVPATPDAVTPVEQGTIEMTDEEWQAWGTQEDNTYRATIVAKRLNLTIK